MHSPYVAAEFATACREAPWVDSMSDLLELRDIVPGNEAPGPPGIRVDNVHLDTGATLSVYRSDEALGWNDEARSAGGTILWLHGGGHVTGSSRQDAALIARLCRSLGVVVFGLEYRLSPESPFPQALEDCSAALRHMASTHPDGSRPAIVGVSAGGTLAATVSTSREFRGQSELSTQVLIYPMLDNRMATPSSSWTTPVWSARANTYAWKAYLGGAAEDADALQRAVPALAADISGCPPTMLVLGGADRFVCEGLDYSQRLVADGVPTEVRLCAGAPHAFLNLAPRSRTTNAVVADILGWLRMWLGNPAGSG